MPLGRSRHYLAVTLLLCACLIVGCVPPNPQSSQIQQSPQGSQGSPKLSVYYKAPIIPIKVEYDVINQTLSMSISGELQTPLGTFGVTTGATMAQKKFSGVRTLIIQAGEKIYVYRLDTGNRYSINLPSDENGQTKVIYSGEDDNLSIVIPNPTDETVAGLREQLRTEQEARKQERAEAETREAERQTAEQAAAEARRQQEEDAAAERRRAEEETARRQREWQAHEDERRRELDEERRRSAEAERRQQEAESRSQEGARQGDVPARRGGETGRPTKGDVLMDVLKTTNEILKDVERRRGSRRRP